MSARSSVARMSLLKLFEVVLHLDDRLSELPVFSLASLDVAVLGKLLSTFF